MLYGIDGKILHLKELDFIERTLFGTVLNPTKFYNDLAEYMENEDIGKKPYITTSELKSLDEFINDYLDALIPSHKTWMLRAYVIGRMLADAEKTAKAFKIIDVSLLPEDIQTAAKEFGLSVEEVKAIESTIENGATLITNTTPEVVQMVRQSVIESIKRGEGQEGALKRIYGLLDGDIGEINREWQRVAITETNTAFANGYLSMQNEGDLVVGLSMPDACDSCLDLINGKIYKVRKEPPPDYTNLEGEEYEKIAKIWETEIWEGKNNFGRSPSRRKRIDPRKGNTKDNLRAKEHHENSMPVIPMHPHCRCKWINFNPKYQFVDENHEIRLRVEDPQKYEKWKRTHSDLFNLEKNNK